MFAAVVWGACAGMGAEWLVRVRGPKWLWLTAVPVIALLAALSVAKPQLVTARDGMSGVSTHWFPLAAFLTALCAQVASWRRWSRTAAVMGSIVSWLVLVGPTSWYA